MDYPQNASLIADRFHQVQSIITQVAQQADRNPAEISLVVVTKGHPLATVRSVIAAGACHLGENYVEEAVPKIAGCIDQPGVTWHMIGHVQSRKAPSVAEQFSIVHSVDSLHLARRLDRSAYRIGKVMTILLECNVSGEQTKYGWPVRSAEQLIAFRKDVGELLQLSNLKMIGLMTIAPEFYDPEATRPFFKSLRQLLVQLNNEFPADRFPQADWKNLSMGMSGDFQVAIQEGATLVRIGTAILGPRPPAPILH